MKILGIDYGEKSLKKHTKEFKIFYFSLLTLFYGARKFKEKIFGF